MNYLKNDKVGWGSRDNSGSTDAGRVSDGQQHQVPAFCIFARTSRSRLTRLDIGSLLLQYGN